MVDMLTPCSNYSFPLCRGSSNNRSSRGQFRPHRRDKGLGILLVSCPPQEVIAPSPDKGSSNNRSSRGQFRPPQGQGVWQPSKTIKLSSISVSASRMSPQCFLEGRVGRKMPQQHEHYSFIVSFHWGHGGAVVIHSPPTFEVCCSNPGPYVGMLVVVYQWSAVYSTEP